MVNKTARLMRADRFPRLSNGSPLTSFADGRSPELFAVYPDETGVEPLRCDHGPDRGQARQIASGDYIFISDLYRTVASPALHPPSPIRLSCPNPIANPQARLLKFPTLTGS
jgi:hypothetical protein